MYASGEAAYERLTSELCVKALHAFRTYVPAGGWVYALDWQHPAFRFSPHREFAFSSEDDWPVPVLPNGDYHIFLTPDFGCGLFGHPWGHTICVRTRSTLTTPLLGKS